MLPPALVHHRVFLSYSRWDEGAAVAVHGQLRTPRDGLTAQEVFFAENDQLSSHPDPSMQRLLRSLLDDRQRLEGRYVKWLLDHLVGSQCCIALVSRRYLESPWCNLELQAAGNLVRRSAERSLVIIPLDDSTAALADDLKPYVTVDPIDTSVREVRARMSSASPTSAALADLSSRPFHDLPIDLLWQTDRGRQGSEPPFQTAGFNSRARPPLSEYELEVRQEMLASTNWTYVSRSQAGEVEHRLDLARGPAWKRWLERARLGGCAAAERYQPARTWYRRFTGEVVDPVPLFEDAAVNLDQARSDARDLIQRGVSPFRPPVGLEVVEGLSPEDRYGTLRSLTGLSPLELIPFAYAAGRNALRRGWLESAISFLKECASMALVDSAILLARAYYLSDSYDQSLETLAPVNNPPRGRRALFIVQVSSTSESHALAAACLARLGRADDARLARERALALDEHFTVAAESERTLTWRMEDRQKWLDGLALAGFRA